MRSRTRAWRWPEPWRPECPLGLQRDTRAKMILERSGHTRAGTGVGARGGTGVGARAFLVTHVLFTIPCKDRARLHAHCAAWAPRLSDSAAFGMCGALPLARRYITRRRRTKVKKRCFFFPRFSWRSLESHPDTSMSSGLGGGPRFKPA